MLQEFKSKGWRFNFVRFDISLFETIRSVLIILQFDLIIRKPSEQIQNFKEHFVFVLRLITIIVLQLKNIIIYSSTDGNSHKIINNIVVNCTLALNDT